MNEAQVRELQLLQFAHLLHTINAFLMVCDKTNGLRRRLNGLTKVNVC